MGKVTLLFAGKSYDTDVQSVRENQIVIFDGPYNMRQRMVVAGIAHTQSGYNYRLIDPETAEKMPTDKLVDISPMALRMSSPFNAGYWLTAA